MQISPGEKKPKSHRSTAGGSQSWSGGITAADASPGDLPTTKAKPSPALRHQPPQDQQRGSPSHFRPRSETRRRRRQHCRSTAYLPSSLGVACSGASTHQSSRNLQAVAISPGGSPSEPQGLESEREASCGRNREDTSPTVRAQGSRLRAANRKEYTASAQYLP